MNGILGFSNPVSGRPDGSLKNLNRKGNAVFGVEYNAEPQLMIGWHQPAYLTVISMCWRSYSDLLVSGRSSRLYKRLVVEGQTALSVSGATRFPAPGIHRCSFFMPSRMDPHTTRRT